MDQILTKRNLKKPIHLLNHIAMKIAYKLRLSHVPLLPTTIDVEPNNWCNFRCDHCQVTHWDKPKNELTTVQFNQIIKQFPRLLLVTVQGMGEPFLNKSTIDMISSLDQKGISSMTTSNGSVMPESLLNKIAKLNYFSLSFSIDGGSKETFEKIRARGNFNKVTENIRKLVDKCPTLDLRFWMVLSNENRHECEAVVDVANDVGVSNVVFQTFITNWGKGEMEEKITNKIITPEKTQGFIDSAIAKGATNQITVKSYSDDYLSIDKPCEWPWISMFIDATGDVVPCCIIADSNTLNFGNVFKTSIKKIWNSNDYKNFRKMHASGNIPDVCKGCYRQENKRVQFDKKIIPLTLVNS